MTRKLEAWGAHIEAELSALWRRIDGSPRGIAALVCVGTLLTGALTRRWHISVEFYSVVAQVIPVFLLVVAVEGRFFRERHAQPHVEAFRARMFLVLMLISEGCALAVVARRHDSDILRGGALVGLVLVAAAFFVLAHDGPLEPGGDSDEAHG